jgi:translation elongation factor EF-G
MSATLNRDGVLRLITCGSVDDGKSTLIGRLLHDSQAIMDDTLSTLANDSRKHGTTGAGEIDYALLLDGLEAEREQGITIDVAALGADFFGVLFQRRQLVLEDHLRIIEQAADQRGFAVIDAAAGDEPQQALVLVGVEVGEDVLFDQRRNVGHQK